MQSALARAGVASTSARCCATAAWTLTSARRVAGGARRRLAFRVAAVAMPSSSSTTSTPARPFHAPPKRPPPPPPPPVPVPRGATPPGGWAAVGTSPSGAAFIVDKPPGWTSFDVCAAVRAALGVKRVGHAGTLDPLATGVLVVCAGKATKAVPAFTDADKEYTGVLRLGEATPTLDAGSPVCETAGWWHVSDEDLKRAADALTGPAVMQRVPMFSAIKVGGARLYASARAGVEVEDRPERPVRVDAFELTRLGGGGYTPPAADAAAAAKEIARMHARDARAAAEAAVAAAGMEVPDKRKKRRRRKRAGGSVDPVEAAIAEAMAALPPPPPLPAAVDPATPGPHGGRDIAFRVACAKGTYVRTLAADLGKAVGSVAHVLALRRTRVGECQVGGETAWNVEELVAAARAGRGSVAGVQR